MIAADSSSNPWKPELFFAEADELLRKYLFFFPAAAAETTAFAAALQQKRPFFSKDCYPAHVVTSGLVLSPDRRQILMLNPRQQGKWRQPFGHYEAPATLAQSALRSLREETGLARPDLHVRHERTGIPADIEEWRVPSGTGTGEPAHVHIDIRYVFIAQSTKIGEDEAQRPDVVFVALDRLPVLAPRLLAKLQPYL